MEIGYSARPEFGCSKRMRGSRGVCQRFDGDAAAAPEEGDP